MNPEEINIEDFTLLRQELKEELAEIENIIPEELIRTEEEMMRKSVTNSVLLILGGLAIILGIYIPNWGILTFIGFIVSLIVSRKIWRKIKIFEKFRDKAVKGVGFLKSRIKNAWNFLLGKGKSKEYSSVHFREKNRNKGVLFGTLAKLANSEGIDVKWLRLGFVLGAVFSGFFPVFIGYLILTAVMPSIMEKKSRQKRRHIGIKSQKRTVRYTINTSEKRLEKYESWEYWDW